jgi:hypothetical protein
MQKIISPLNAQQDEITVQGDLEALEIALCKKTMFVL